MDTVQNDSYDEYDVCPHCGSAWTGYECGICGFSDTLLKNEYETPTGFITHCTEKEAFKEGYIYMCPACDENIITWWENEDHGKCIDCWHRQNAVDRL